MVRSTGTRQKKKKKKGGGKMQGGILATTCPRHLPPALVTSQHIGMGHSTPFWAVLEWERSERKRIKEELKLENQVLAGGIPFCATLFNDFQGSSLRFLDVFHYFRVWGIQKCQEKILFRKEKMSFWAFKNSVHLGLKEQIFTRFCFDWFGGYRSPNQERFSFLEIPLCLVYGPKISAN